MTERQAEIRKLQRITTGVLAAGLCLMLVLAGFALLTTKNALIEQQRREQVVLDQVTVLLTELDEHQTYSRKQAEASRESRQDIIKLLRAIINELERLDPRRDFGVLEDQIEQADQGDRADANAPPRNNAEPSTRPSTPPADTPRRPQPEPPPRPPNPPPDPPDEPNVVERGINTVREAIDDVIP